MGPFLNCTVAVFLISSCLVGTAAELQAVHGKDNPEGIPEWVALKSVMQAAELHVARDQDAGVRRFAKTAGISETAARAVVGYHRELLAEDKKEPTLKAAICPKYSTLTSADSLAAEVKRFDDAMSERSRQRAEGVYSVLSAEDASNLRKHVLAWRKNVTAIKGERPIDDDPIAFLNRVCGGTP